MRRSWFDRVIYMTLETRLPHPGEGVIHFYADWRLIKFRCPCGCGSLVYLYVGEHGNGPRWEVKEEVGEAGRLISVEPSIVIGTGCRSHFFIMRNQVVWMDSVGWEPEGNV